MKTYNIVEKKRLWFGISLAIIAIGLISLLMNGFNMGIDFTGGNILHYDMHEAYSLPEVRNTLNNFDIKYEAKKAGKAEQELIIKTATLSKDEQLKITDVLKQKWAKIELVQSEAIDPVIGKELQKQAVLALIIANIGMLIYITFRFELKSAVGAVIALIHDILIVLSFYAIFQIPVDSSFIAVILTIVGYSINDTIVIFDRIRENLKTSKKASFDKIVNTSISQTLTRTMNTSVTTLITITALFLLGGETIRDFTLALIVGLVSGTYSSIFIASPLWAMFRQKAKIAKA